jgi:hypothetical protein
LEPLLRLEAATACELRSIGFEVARVERTVKRLKAEKLQLEVFSAFADPLLFRALDGGPQLMTLAEVKKLPAKRRFARLRWDKAIRAVQAQILAAQKQVSEQEKKVEEQRKKLMEAHEAEFAAKAAKLAVLLLEEEAEEGQEDHDAILAAAGEEHRRFPQLGPWAFRDTRQVVSAVGRSAEEHRAALAVTTGASASPRETTTLLH